MPDVIINISDGSRALTQAGFGKPLIIGVTAAIDGDKDTYKEYASLSEVSSDYASATEEYLAAQMIFSQEPRPATLAIVNVTRSEPAEAADLVGALDTIAPANNDWYFVILTSRDFDDIKAVAAWASANEKIMGVSVGSVDNSVSVDSIKTLGSEIASDRCFILAHQVPSKFGEAGIIGKMAPKRPGTTWKFKTVNTLTNSGYDTTDTASFKAGSVNTYIEQYGILMFTEGYMTDGSFIDVRRAKDYIKARMAESIMSLLINNDVVPYEISGITAVKAVIEGSLKLRAQEGIIAKDENNEPIIEVWAPSMDSIDQNDKNNRIAKGYGWKAQLSGALHGIEIDGIIV